MNVYLWCPFEEAIFNKDNQLLSFFTVYEGRGGVGLGAKVLLPLVYNEVLSQE